jgi:chromosome segregation ATPase
MSTLEQVKLLETKVAKAIDYVHQLTGENTLLKQQLSGYQTKIDELEVLVKQFKEDQGRIEGGILSALDRLNQFEDAIAKGIADIVPKSEKPAAIPVNSTEKKEFSVVTPEKESVFSDKPDDTSDSSVDKSEDNTLFSEITPAADSDIPEDEALRDAAIMAALEAEEQAAKLKNAGASPSEHAAELDIF